MLHLRCLEPVEDTMDGIHEREASYGTVPGSIGLEIGRSTEENERRSSQRHPLEDIEQTAPFICSG